MNHGDPLWRFSQGRRWRRLFVALTLLLAPLTCHALTVGDIIDRSRLLLRDNFSQATRQRFSNSQLIDWINDAQREANSFAWVLQSSYTVALIGGTTEYAMPSDFQATWRVIYKNKKINQTSLNQLDAESINWRTVSGEVNSYYLYLTSTPVIGFYPAPVNTSTGTAIIYYLQQPTELTSTTQTPWNGWTQLAPYHSGLSYFVAYRGLWTVGDVELADRYLAEWQQFIAAMKQGLMQAPDFNPGFGGRRTE